MKFTGTLDTSSQRRVQECDALLNDPQRLAALAQTGLMDSPCEQAFDRLAQLAARILGVPLTIVSLVGSDRQFFKAAAGLPPPYDTSRQIPIDGSICRYTLAGEPIIVADAATDPLLMNHPATKPWGIGAFIAMPMVDEAGHALGAFCAVDRQKRAWSEDDIYVLRELTASVMTEINLRLQVAELFRQRQVRERIVAAITHDLRTPITSALMSAELLAKKLPESPALKRSAKRIIDGMARTDQMIGDLLDSCRLQAGGAITVTRTEGDLAALTQDVVDEAANVHGARFAVESTGPVLATFDAHAVQRVLENLLGNAVKYGRADTPIRVQVAQQGADAVLAVQNAGDPIPAADQATLFEPYRRAPAATHSGKIGWGIGLTLVRGVVEAHHGCVTVGSAADTGTTFTVRFPRHAP